MVKIWQKITWSSQKPLASLKSCVFITRTLWQGMNFILNLKFFSFPEDQPPHLNHSDYPIFAEVFHFVTWIFQLIRNIKGSWDEKAYNLYDIRLPEIWNFLIFILISVILSEIFSQTEENSSTQFFILNVCHCFTILKIVDKY